MNKHGFTLIELMIGLMLSSIVAYTLYNSFFITNTVVRKTEQVISADLIMAVLQNRLQKDVNGIFIPVQPEPEKKDTAGDAAQKAPVQPKQNKPPIKPVEKIFHSTQKDKNLDFLTFITNNPVQSYQDGQKGKIKPSVVRVVYRLEPTETDPETFRLMRQESADLDLKNFDAKTAQGVRAYQLATDIKSISAEFIYPQPKKEESKAAQSGAKPGAAAPKKEEKKEPITFVTLQKWDADKLQDGQPKIPEYITFTITLWDKEHKAERTNSFKYTVEGFQAAMQPKKPKAQPGKPAVDTKTTGTGIDLAMGDFSTIVNATQINPDGSYGATVPMSLAQYNELQAQLQARLAEHEKRREAMLANAQRPRGPHAGFGPTAFGDRPVRPIGANIGAIR